MNNEVSVIITTKNEERNIENCLLSIKNQTISGAEIIVVDNQSSDHTKEIARKYTDQVYDKGPERSAQRNFGMIEISKRKYVMFVDADMILAPCLLERALQFMRKQEESGTGVAALHISEVVLGKNFFSGVRRFERSFYDGTVIDGARFFLREAFVSVGGFDESMSGPEDWDIDKKIKNIASIALLPGRDEGSRNCSGSEEWIDYLRQRGVDPRSFGPVIYHNESEFLLGPYLKKKGYYARSFDGYIQKWGKTDTDIQKQFGVTYRFFGVFLEKGKWFRLLVSPHHTVGMYFLRFLVGMRFLMRGSRKESDS